VTLVALAAMVPRCQEAADLLAQRGISCEVIDLRTIRPWDREAVLASVRKTHRLVVVHEATLTAGFGAEIAAVLAKEAFFHLDAPIERLTMPDIPNPHSPILLDAAVPTVGGIMQVIRRVASV